MKNFLSIYIIIISFLVFPFVGNAIEETDLTQNNESEVVNFPGNPAMPSQEEIDLKREETGYNDFVEGSDIKSNEPLCFDYYTFQSVHTSFGTEKDLFKPGEIVRVSGEVINENEYPVVDGNLFVRVSLENDNYQEEGNFIIDEFIVAENVAIDKKTNKSISFEWEIPESVSAGRYTFDYFFSVGKKFNLGGLPFSNEVVAGNTSFDVVTGETQFVSFDRSKTTVDGLPYEHIGSWPRILEGGKVKIIQPILNTFNESKNVHVVYELYHWDSLNENDLADTKTEELVLSSGESIDLEYTIPKMDDSAYYLKITATSGEIKSIVNIRVVSNQSHLRLNYPAITKFPLEQGDDFTLFTCFHNGSDAPASGKVNVTIYDKKGNEIGSTSYEGGISAAMMVSKNDLIAQEKYDYVKLKAEIYDQNNNIVDQYETVYTCKALNNCGPFSFGDIWFVLLLLVIIIGYLGYPWFKKSYMKNVSLLMFSILTAFVFNGLFVTQDAEAYYQKSVTTSKAYTFYRYLRADDIRLISSGTVSIPQTVDMVKGGYSVYKGAEIDFAYNNSLVYSASNGFWDTPYGYWCSSINSLCANIWAGQQIYDQSDINWWMSKYHTVSDAEWYAAGLAEDRFKEARILWTGVRPNTYMISSNPSVVSCSAMDCVAVGNGTARLTAYAAPINVRIWAYVEFALAWEWISETLPYLNNIKTNQMRMSASAVNIGSWDISVSTPIPFVTGSCGTRDGVTYPYTSTTWGTGTFCSAGTVSPTSPVFPEQGETTNWQCLGSGGGSTASCSANRDTDPALDLVNGVCGTYDGTEYPYTATTWGVGSFCSAGLTSPTSPLFPDQGSSTSWLCNGLNGGVDSSCDASRDEDPLAGCGNSLCDGGETLATCPSDCAVCPDTYCTPEGGETAATCPSDCYVPLCGDNLCESGETLTTCPSDCPTCPDTYCTTEGGENELTCPSDCPPVCGNGLCGLGEDVSCPDDCPPVCGDSVCETERGENYVNCSADCSMDIREF